VVVVVTSDDVAISVELTGGAAAEELAIGITSLDVGAAELDGAGSDEATALVLDGAGALDGSAVGSALDSVATSVLAVVLLGATEVEVAALGAAVVLAGDDPPEDPPLYTAGPGMV
jgi:hypothetical protein